VGDRSAEGALLLGSFRIDVNPLKVAGRLGELVHPLLGDLHPIAVAKMLADDLFQAGGSVNGSC
jgi:hypothetical protein